MDTALAANVRAVAEDWPGITRIEGQTQPRPIADSGGKLSEHTFGNALDIYGSRRAMSSLAAHLNENRGQLGIRTLCYDGGPGPNYDKCTTPHIDHIHTDMAPNCAGVVPSTGGDRERRDKCNEYQQKGGVVTVDKNAGKVPDEGGGLFGLGNIGESIENAMTTILYVGIGVVLVAGGIAMAVTDSGAVKVIKGAVTKLGTKGAI